MAKNILDGKYAGELTAEEVIEQFEYRAGIHLSYINLLDNEPYAGWVVYGSKEFHLWAINGYEWGIKYVQENNPVVYRCNLTEALTTISRFIINHFRRGG